MLVQALYLAGLLVYMGLDVRNGYVLMPSDALMPYELALVAILIAYQAASMLNRIRIRKAIGERTKRR